jgi:hypothetical protein
MNLRGMIGTLAGATFLSGCTFQGALDAMVDPDRQADIIQTAQTLCREPQSLQPQFAPDFWAQSPPMIAQVRLQCPTEPGAAWQLTNYNFNTSADRGAPTDRREFVRVVAGDADGPWSEIQLNFQQLGDSPRQIIGWNVARTTTRPASLAFIDSYDQIRWWASGGAALFLIALLATLSWFRRRRRTQGKRWTDA